MAFVPVERGASSARKLFRRTCERQRARGICSRIARARRVRGRRSGQRGSERLVDVPIERERVECEGEGGVPVDVHGDSERLGDVLIERGGVGGGPTSQTPSPV